MSKWKCEICNSEFDNFQAQGFNHKIYCPLCYFKELNIRKDKEIERLNNEIKTLLKENGNKEKVITKQNNIINELEKCLEEEIKEERPKDHLWLMGYYDASKDYLKRLKELKKINNNML